MTRRIGWIGVIACLCLALFAACSDKPTNDPPSEAQIKAFKAAKSVGLSIDQSYEGNIRARLPAGGLPFEMTSAAIMAHAGLQPGRGGDIKLKVKAKGSVENGKSVIRGTYTFKLPGAPSYTRAFEGVTFKPHLTSYYKRLGVTYFDTDVIGVNGSFLSRLLETVQQTYGVDAVVASLRDKRKEVRRNAAWVLGQYKQTGAVPALIAAFLDEDALVKSEAVDALAKVGQPAVEYLQVALRDKDMVIRRHATTALARIANPESIEPWIEALRDDDPKVQETAIATLARAGAAAVDPLIDKLRDSDRYFRRSVVKALGELEDPKAVAPLIDALKDEDPAIQKAAADALVKIGKSSVDPLLANLNDKNPRIRIAAASALGDLKDPKAVDPLIALLSDKDKLVRIAATVALGTIGDKKAVGPLTEAMNDKKLDIKDAASSAIEKLNKGQKK